MPVSHSLTHVWFRLSTSQDIIGIICSVEYLKQKVEFHMYWTIREYPQQRNYSYIEFITIIYFPNNLTICVPHISKPFIDYDKSI